MLKVIDSPITRWAQEAERRRIARELHDGVVQSLTALVADLEYFQTCRLNGEGETVREVAAKIATWQELARDSLLSMRQALGGLRNRGEPERGLETGIQALLKELEQVGYTVICTSTDWPAYLPRDYCSNLYFIVRESLINVCKHAQASRISIFMFSHQERLHISIGDNGIGIRDLPQAQAAREPDGHHQGLLGLQERAVLLGGKVSIESKPGKGTRIDVDVPLPCSTKGGNPQDSLHKSRRVV